MFQVHILATHSTFSRLSPRCSLSVLSHRILSQHTTEAWASLYIRIVQIHPHQPNSTPRLDNARVAAYMLSS